MSIDETARRVRRGERAMLRLQRRLWLAQLALWPTAILLAGSVSVAAWVVWRRRSSEARSISPAIPTDAPEQAFPSAAPGY